jgi:hypothetical protein
MLIFEIVEIERWTISQEGEQGAKLFILKWYIITKFYFKRLASLEGSRGKSKFTRFSMDTPIGFIGRKAVKMKKPN